MTVTVDELKQAYDAVESATEKAQFSGIEFELNKETLEMVIAKATAAGEIQGSNEDKRKAAARDMFQNDYAELGKLELAYKRDSNTLTLAKIHLDFVRDCIRIEELAKK